MAQQFEDACPYSSTFATCNMFVCARLPAFLRTQFFFLITGLRVLNRLSPDLPFPLATPLTVTPGCWSTLSNVVFLIAAGEIRSWSAKNCNSLGEEVKPSTVQYKCGLCVCVIFTSVLSINSNFPLHANLWHQTGVTWHKQDPGRTSYMPQTLLFV